MERGRTRPPPSEKRGWKLFVEPRPAGDSGSGQVRKGGLAGDHLAAAEPACRAFFGTPHQPLHHGCGREGNYQAVKLRSLWWAAAAGCDLLPCGLSPPPNRRAFHGFFSSKTNSG